VLHEGTRGYAAGAAAYERGRPGYAAAALEALTAALGLGPGARVLDVGAGTGKLTHQLLGTGARPVAVEPVAAMREGFRRALPGVPLLAGTAEALPLRDGSITVAVAGQAWHWFDAPAALAELTRVVAPGGGLALLWYEFDRSVPWAAELARVRDRRAPAGLPDPRTGRWRRPFDGHPAWAPLTERHFPHVQRLARGGVVDRLLSSSCIAALPPADREDVRREVLALLDRAAETRGREEVGLPYRTEVHWTRRR
jgi:SAM-dependent methyltransferase